MNIKQRNEHLGQYFSEEVLSQLDEAQKTVLYEEFANSELKLLATQPIETIKAQTDRKSSAEFERRLSFIQEEEYPLLKDWYLSISNSLYEIICSKCGALLGLEIDTKDDNFNNHHHEGKFVVAMGKLYAYRPRIDGVMGYQCANEVETEYKDEWEKFLPAYEAAVADKQQAGRDFYDANEEYSKLSPKQKAKTEPPVERIVELPIEPAGPPYIVCGNDTRVSQIETDVISEEHLMTSTTKEDIVSVKQEMNATNYEPDVIKTKRGYKVESFELREVKQ